MNHNSLGVFFLTCSVLLDCNCRGCLVREVFLVSNSIGNEMKTIFCFHFLFIFQDFW